MPYGPRRYFQKFTAFYVLTINVYVFIKNKLLGGAGGGGYIFSAGTCISEFLGT